MIILIMAPLSFTLTVSHVATSWVWLCSCLALLLFNIYSAKFMALPCTGRAGETFSCGACHMNSFLLPGSRISVSVGFIPGLQRLLPATYGGLSPKDKGTSPNTANRTRECKPAAWTTGRVFPNTICHHASLPGKIQAPCVRCLRQRCNRLVALYRGLSSEPYEPCNSSPHAESQGLEYLQSSHPSPPRPCKHR